MFPCVLMSLESKYTWQKLRHYFVLGIRLQFTSNRYGVRVIDIVLCNQVYIHNYCLALLYQWFLFSLQLCWFKRTVV